MSKDSLAYTKEIVNKTCSFSHFFALLKKGENMNKGKDRASKLFFSDKRNAKDLVSLVLRRLGIEEEPKEVEEADPVLSFMDRKFSLERLLDKLFKVTLSNEETSTFCFVGLENQSKFDAHMLIRAGIASLLLYDRALQRKEKLKPVVIAVLNMGDRKWKGPVSLEEYFSKEDLELFGPLMVNVRMVVIDPYAMDEEEMEWLKTDLDLVLNVIKYKSDKEQFYGYINKEKRFCNLSELTARLIYELANIEIDEGEWNMCKAIEDLKKDSWLDGMEKGMERTIFSLRREGYLRKEDAASKLHLSVDEYSSREDLFFHDSAPLANS